MSHVPLALGPRVKARRTALCLTQAALAELAGISQPTVGRVERSSEATDDARAKIEAALDAAERERKRRSQPVSVASVKATPTARRPVPPEPPRTQAQPFDRGLPEPTGGDRVRREMAIARSPADLGLPHAAPAAPTPRPAEVPLDALQALYVVLHPGKAYPGHVEAADEVRGEVVALRVEVEDLRCQVEDLRCQVDAADEWMNAGGIPELGVHHERVAYAVGLRAGKRS